MSNNKIIIEGCIETFKNSNQLELNDSEIFELFSLSQIHKNKNITFENIEHSIVDGSNDGGIDSIMIFINDEYIENLDDLNNFDFNNKTKSKFIISQCKKENSFKESALDKLITTAPIIFDLEKTETALLSRFNSDIVSQIMTLTNVWKKTAVAGGEISLDYIYVCNAPKIEINNVFKEKRTQLINITKTHLSIEHISFFEYSSTELLKLYQQQQKNRLSLEFKDRPLSIEFENNGIGYIGTVKLNKYKEFLSSESEEIRDDLFESNIRHYQGLVDVNKKIKNTVENISTDDFWWLNNGITIIAEEPKEVGKTLSIENIQIVNGLQTSYSIFNSEINSEDNRSVLVKVIINNDKTTTDNIIASTNSQNPVSITLLRATEPIQRNLELFFLQNGYYYDRRKNFYKNQGRPLSKIFSIQYAAQSIKSIIFDEPHIARTSPTSLFKNENTYNSIFNPNNDFSAYLNSCIINRKVNNFWIKYTNPQIKQNTSNFKLHLACLIVKMYFSKNSTTVEDIKEINLEDIDTDLFERTIEKLNKKIFSYLDKNKDKNLINTAKSKDFTIHMLKD